MTMTLTRPESPESAETVPGGLRLLLVDDHKLLAETLQAALSLAGFDATVAPCGAAAEVLAAAADLQPGLVVLDLELDAAGHGCDLVGPLRQLGAAVVVLTGTTDRIQLARCLEAGALGVVSKADGFGAVLDNIRRAAAGESVTPVNDRMRLLTELDASRRADQRRWAPFEKLSEREREVLRMIVEGDQAAAIARASYVSLATVRTQIRSILMKLEVTSQVAAVALARQYGWFDAPTAAVCR
jgi:two-component system nitrate/nitrite response regulator NarL